MKHVKKIKTEKPEIKETPKKKDKDLSARAQLRQNAVAEHACPEL